MSKRFSEGHKLNEDLKIKILQDRLTSKPVHQFHEDLWICCLETLQPTGLNNGIGQSVINPIK